MSTEIMKHEWKKITPDHDVEFVSDDWHLTIQKDGTVFFTTRKLIATPNGYAKGKTEAVKRFIENCDTFEKELSVARAEAEQILAEFTEESTNVF